MGKWLWRYALEREALRRRVIDTNMVVYGGAGALISYRTLMRFSCGRV